MELLIKKMPNENFPMGREVAEYKKYNNLNI